MRPFACMALLGALLCCASLATAEQPRCRGREPGLSPAAHQALVKAKGLWSQKSHGQALKLLQQYASNHPNHGHHILSFWLGYLNYLLGQRERAATHLTRAVELWPCMAEAWRNLAVIRLEQKRPALAAELMLKAHHFQRPPNPELLYQAAAFWLVAQKPAKAVPILQSLVSQAKPKVHWLEALIRAHIEMKNPKQAQRVLDRALAFFPDRERLWRTAAWLAADQRNYPRSVAALGVAYGLKPPEDAQWRQLGDLYRAARVPAKAAAAYERAFGTKPTPKQLDLLARTYLLAQMPDMALETAGKAFKRKPSHKRMALLGRIHLARRELGRAMKSYEQAAKLGGDAPRYWLMAGRLAWRLGQLPRAERYLSQAAAKAKPGSPTAKEAARALKIIQRYLKQAKAVKESKDHAGMHTTGH